MEEQRQRTESTRLASFCFTEFLRGHNESLQVEPGKLNIKLSCVSKPGREAVNFRTIITLANWSS